MRGGGVGGSPPFDGTFTDFLFLDDAMGEEEGTQSRLHPVRARLPGLGALAPHSVLLLGNAAGLGA
jgi:hypothetical protein